MGFPATAPNASSLPYAIKATGWRLSASVAGFGLGLALSLLLALGLARSAHPIAVGPMLGDLGVLGFAALCALGLWRLKDPVVELYPDRLIRRGLFGPVVLYRADIEGVSQIYSTRSGSYFNVVALPGRGQSVTFPARLRSDPAFAEWLAGAPDPAAVDRAADRASVLADDRYGATEADRASQLAWARRIVLGFSAICAGAAVWLGFFGPPKPYPLAVAGGALIAALVMVAASNGLIIVWRPRAGVRPMVPAAILPAAALALRGLLTVHLLTPQPLAIAAVVAGVGAALALSQQSSASGQRLPAALGAGLFAAAFAYGAGAYLDSLSAGRPDDSFFVTVEGKHESHGRSMTYYLDLDAWGDQPAKSVSVSSDLYGAVDAGASVCIDRYPGDLRLPWFDIGLCKTAPQPAAAPAPAATN